MIRTASAESFSWKPGRITVLTFCAFWCDTWKTQVPRLQEAEASLTGLPVDFLTISLDGRWTELAQPKGWTLLTDPGASFSNKIGVDRVPYTFVVDEQGVVRWASFGIIRSQVLIERVREALQPRASAAEVYLTFDDFPSLGDDEPLLDVLRAEGVPATFFCIGQNIEGREGVVQRASDEGHSLQLHSWDHDGAKPAHDKSLGAFARIGLAPTLYRPPGSTDLIRLSGGALKLATVAPFDYKRPGAKEIARRVLLGTRPGMVIQLHAGVRDTVEALPEIIRNLRGRGFSFATLH